LVKIKLPATVNISKIIKAAKVDRAAIEKSSLRENGGFFELNNKILLGGLINAKKYIVFSMICGKFMVNNIACFLTKINR